MQKCGSYCTSKYQHASIDFHVILGRGISRRGMENSQIEDWLLVLLLLVL